MIEASKVLLYMALGIPILVLDMGSDFFYFWANNFRSNLKTIIIVKEKSNITNVSIRSLAQFCNRYNEERVKSLFCEKTVIIMRERYMIKENIQYLLFGQFTNKGAGSSLKQGGTATLKNTRT
jgi:hypothetical protein